MFVMLILRRPFWGGSATISYVLAKTSGLSVAELISIEMMFCTHLMMSCVMPCTCGSATGFALTRMFYCAVTRVLRWEEAMTKPWKSHRELITRFFIVSRKSIKSTSVRSPVIVRILLQFPPKGMNRDKNFLIMEIPNNFSPTKNFRTILHSKTVSSSFTGSLLIWDT